MSTGSAFGRDVCVVGGGGHVGLPLALTFADAGFRTLIYDTNAATVAKIRRAEMPFSRGRAGAAPADSADGTPRGQRNPEHMSDCSLHRARHRHAGRSALTPSFSGNEKGDRRVRLPRSATGRS
jgi:NAD(P)-dependent dehydrogenase (short-subunit alcohol dehydrogenase family)